MAATFTTSCTFTEISPNPGYKEIIVETPASFGADDLEMTLGDHGISTTGFLTVNGYQMSTTYGIVTTEAPTTFVASGVLVISSAATSITPAKKIYRVVGKSA